MFEVVTRVTPRANRCLQQIAQDHRVADIGDEKFIETEHPRLCGEVRGDVDAADLRGPRAWFSSACTRPMKRWKCRRSLCSNGSDSRNRSMRNVLPRPTAAPQIQAAHRRCRAQSHVATNRCRSAAISSAWMRSRCVSAARCAASSCQRPSATPRAYRALGVVAAAPGVSFMRSRRQPAVAAARAPGLARCRAVRSDGDGRNARFLAGAPGSAAACCAAT